MIRNCILVIIMIITFHHVFLFTPPTFFNFIFEFIFFFLYVTMTERKIWQHGGLLRNWVTFNNESFRSNEDKGCRKKISNQFIQPKIFNNHNRKFVSHGDPLRITTFIFFFVVVNKKFFNWEKYHVTKYKSVPF